MFEFQERIPFVVVLRLWVHIWMSLSLKDLWDVCNLHKKEAATKKTLSSHHRCHATSFHTKLTVWRFVHIFLNFQRLLQLYSNSIAQTFNSICELVFPWICSHFNALSPVNALTSDFHSDTILFTMMKLIRNCITFYLASIRNNYTNLNYESHIHET